MINFDYCIEGTNIFIINNKGETVRLSGRYAREFTPGIPHSDAALDEYLGSWFNRMQAVLA